MSKGNISKKQEEILEYIKSQILQRGFPPAVREICDAVNLKSTSSVHSHLETLEKNGYIRRDPTKPRAIEILDDSFNLTRREMVQIPIVGHVAAGEPVLAQENIEDYYPVPTEYISSNKENFIVSVFIGFLCEFMQLIFHRGVFDLGDISLYVVGILLGIYVKEKYHVHLKEKSEVHDN